VRAFSNLDIRKTKQEEEEEDKDAETKKQNENELKHARERQRYIFRGQALVQEVLLDPSHRFMVTMKRACGCVC